MIKLVCRIVALLWACNAFALPAINSDLSGVSCMVTEVRNETELKNDSHGFCSGTFLSKNVFVTAAHCLSNSVTQIGLIKDSDKQLFISCPNNKYFRVHGSIPKHDYFQASEFDKSGKLNLNFDHTYRVNGKNDIALLITDDNIQSFYPGIDAIVDTRFCRILGYSSFVCNRETGENCERNLSKLFYFVNENFYGSESDITDKGDSGGGIVCGAGRNLNVIGIIASVDPRESIVNIVPHREFINSYLNKSTTELLEEARKIESTKTALEVIKKGSLIKRQFYSQYKISVICSDADPTNCLSIWTLYEEIYRDKTLVEKLKKSGIKILTVYHEPLPQKIVVATHDNSILWIKSDANISDFYKSNFTPSTGREITINYRPNL